MRSLATFSLGLLILTLHVPTAFAKIMPDDFLLPRVMESSSTPGTTSTDTGESFYFASEIVDGKLTRAHFVDALATRLYTADEHDTCYADLVLSETYNYSLLFNDVSLDASYASSICVAMKNGLVSGYRDGTFRPNALITVGEASAILTRAAGLTHRDSNHMIKKEAWYQPYIDAMRSVDREFTMPASDALTGMHLKHEMCVLEKSMPALDPLDEFSGC